MATLSPETAKHKSSICHRRRRPAITSLVLFLAACVSGLQAQTPPPLSIVGPTQVRLGGNANYTALVNGGSPIVVWSVDGFAGGKVSYGTISSSGMYSPGNAIYAGHSVTIAATTQSTPVSSASLNVKILNQLPILTGGSVTQTVAGTSFLLDVDGSNFVPASQLLFAGKNVATTFISSTELRSTISVPAGMTNINVGVLNPNAAQKVSVGRTLAVQAIAASPTISPQGVAAGGASQLAFIMQPTSTTTGFSITPSIIVVAEDESGNPVGESSILVTLAFGSNPGSADLAGVLTANTGLTGALFSNLSISQPGAGFTLIASSPGLTAAKSTPFSVNPANTAATYYVSNSGNDDNNGMDPSSPWKSVFKVNSSVIPGGSQVLFQSTGVWHEQIAAEAGIRYGAYGPLGDCTLSLQMVAACVNLPIIDGADIVTGWSAYSGATYRASYDAVASKGFVDSLYSQTIPLTLTGDTANVISTPGTVYSDGGYVYVHLLDGSNPTSHVIEVSGSRMYGILVNGAANTVVDGLEVIRTAKSGYLNYSSAGTGASNVIQNTVLFNNGDSLSDANIGGPIEGAILAIAGYKQAPVAGFIASRNSIGRLDIPHNTLNYTLAGIQVDGMEAPQITGNKVGTVNGWAIRVQDYFAGTCNAPVLASNETVNSEGNIGIAGCPNAVVEFNSMHNSYGNAFEGGAGIELANLSTGVALRYNDFNNLRSAYSGGLYNGIDINHIMNGLAIGNTCLNVSNDCMTLEADSAPSGGWTVIKNSFDASQNVYTDGTAPTSANRVYPFYIRNTSLAAGLMMQANTLVVNTASPYIKYGAASASDKTHDLTQPAFDLACPGCELPGSW
jgi:hypothetical protein